MEFNGKTLTAYAEFDGSASDAVLYTEQQLTEAQKIQARANIGAAGVKTKTETFENGDTAVIYDVSQLVLHGKTKVIPSKNLCSLGTVEFEKDKNFAIEPIPAGEYTISAIVETTDTEDEYCAVLFKDAQNNTVQSCSLPHSVNGERVVGRYWFTLEVPVTSMHLYAASGGGTTTGDTAKWADIQVEAGRNATAYEPYGAQTEGIGAVVSFGDVVFSADAELYDGESLDCVTGLLTKNDGTVETVEVSGKVSALDGKYAVTTEGTVSVTSVVPDASILYTSQELTEEQKAQARENIGAAPDYVVGTEVVQGSINLLNPEDKDVLLGLMQNFKNDSVSISDHSNDDPSKYHYRVTGYIPVTEGQTYTTWHYSAAYSQATGTSVAFYDDSKAYIGFVTGTLAADGECFTLTAPTGAKYARMNFYNLKNTMFVMGDSYPAVYVPYEPPTEKAVLGIPLESAYVQTLMNPLYNRTIIWNGDSICAGNTVWGAWADRIARRNSMKYKNYAIGGGTITENTVNSSGVTHHSISATLDTMYAEYPDADYIIIEGGTNDADNLGSRLNGNTPERFGTFTVSDYSGEYDRDTFCGALESIFFRATNYWKGKKIGFIVAQKMGYYPNGYTAETNNRRNYFETAMQICKKWGIPVLNLWDECHLNPLLPHLYINGATKEENQAAGSLYSDGQHLLSAGYDYTADIVNNWLKTL